jgi:hypothetical protein
MPRFDGACFNTACFDDVGCLVNQDADLDVAPLMTLAPHAFLVYIHPQVIERTNAVSCNMLCHGSFTYAGGFNMADPDIAPESPHAGSMVTMTPSSFHHFNWITERERVKSNHTTSDRKHFNGSGP